ncbi:uncharacterized protein LOC101854116 [Aplysia californica]|uniref:Uncharacterized protein LOC101854116 n=1 Tax=Aplysia californica TaxID=6500 RepID=A0ABM1A8F9_APLCA|nr:uncharacterized protein LOC101854116 [Aplysia californica]
MIRQAELWKKTMLSAHNRPMTSPAAPSPMLSPREHMVLNSLKGPWSQRAAMWHQQMLRARLVQWCQRNLERERLQYEIMRAMQAKGGNPYSVVQPHGQIPHMMVPGFNGMPQQNGIWNQGGNPYSGPQQNIPGPAVVALVHQLSNGHQSRDPQGTHPFAGVSQRPIVQGPGNPYNHVRPFLEPQGRPLPPSYGGPQDRGMRGPLARTPWDLDPFQQNPALLADPRTRAALEKERRLVALAFYQYMMNQQRANDVTRRPSMSGGGYPSPIPPPPVRGIDLPGPIPQNDRAMAGDGLDYNTGHDDQFQSGPGQDTDVTEPQSPAVSMVNDAPMQPNPQGPQMPMAGGPGAMPNGLGEPEAPSQEEIAKMEACRGQLEPEMDTCLDSYKLTLEQFMNPDYMTLARDVCESSASVGQCIMRQDKACGEGTQILITRKMINSVLQMMGMVCQQIMARGDTPMPQPPMGGPSPGGMVPPSLESTNQPLPASSETTDEMPQPDSTEDTEIPALPPTEKPENPKFHPTESKVKSKPTDAPHAAAHSEGPKNQGHDAAHPVSHDGRLAILGYPAWVVITLGVLLVLVLFMSVLLCCVCVRRRRRQKSLAINKEIDKLPEPLDSGKLAAIGIPPPMYTTTPVHQTQDDLTLPPLDLAEEEESEAGALPEKKPQLEEDADDESDDKSGDEKKDKKKEKKEKK